MHLSSLIETTCFRPFLDRVGARVRGLGVRGLPDFCRAKNMVFQNKIWGNPKKIIFFQIFVKKQYVKKILVYPNSF